MTAKFIVLVGKGATLSRKLLLSALPGCRRSYGRLWFAGFGSPRIMIRWVGAADKLLGRALASRLETSILKADHNCAPQRETQSA
jgi:hypothetical protein